MEIPMLTSIRETGMERRKLKISKDMFLWLRNTWTE